MELWKLSWPIFRFLPRSMRYYYGCQTRNANAYSIINPTATETVLLPMVKLSAIAPLMYAVSSNNSGCQQ